ncbi:MAG: hypothetical protein F4X96_06300 [Gammaproteobacteria bacterium]|nr:hypothetical protein [Chromatiales bacterium]MYE49026.1 hypothetical protein [Gammaproteobacteria bacterium]
MLYLLDVQIDYNAIGDRMDELMPAEWEQTEAMIRSGKLLGLWRKANAKGVVAVWDMADHVALNEQIRKMPLYPYMSQVEVVPLVPHPRYPEFAQAAAGLRERISEEE